MRLSGLVICATGALIAASAPLVETRQTVPIQQPTRDVVKRAEPTGTARIKGRVVSADRGTPVRRAMVMLSVVMPRPGTRDELVGQLANAGRAGQPVTIGPQTMTISPRRATTDGDGRFEFAGLPAGTYRISASPAQYSSQYLGMSYGATRPMGMY